MERLFSQLKLVLEQIGVSGLEECYEGRTMTRLNVHYYMYEASKNQ